MEMSRVYAYATRLKLVLRGLLVLSGLVLGLGTARATTFLELQSTCLGNGWFQYEMSVFNDLFFSEADITQLQISFTNEIDQIPGTNNWVNNAWGNNYSSWTFGSGYPARPYVETFLIRSSQTAYKLATTIPNQALVLLSLYCTGINPLTAGACLNIVGFARMPCLVPCSPEEADGSPTNFVYVLKLLPDVAINSLIQSNGVILGVDFSWDYDSTFLLQGSTDFNQWTNIAYIWSESPETIWTTNASLGEYGQYFRVALVAEGHATNLPPLSAALTPAPKTLAKVGVTANAPSVTGCQADNDRMLVSIASQPGQTCEVRALDSHLVVQQTQQITPSGTSATAIFDAASLPNPVFFQVVSVQ
jgi:hypothetical protein